MCLFESTEHVEHAVDRLARVVASFSMSFESSVKSAITSLEDCSIELYTLSGGTNGCRPSRLPRQLSD